MHALEGQPILDPRTLLEAVPWYPPHRERESECDEVQPDDVRPDDVRPDDVRPDDVRPDDVRSDDLRPDDMRNDELRPDVVRPDELRSEAIGTSRPRVFVDPHILQQPIWPFVTRALEQTQLSWTADDSKMDYCEIIVVNTCTVTEVSLACLLQSRCMTRVEWIFAIEAAQMFDLETPSHTSFPAFDSSFDKRALSNLQLVLKEADLTKVSVSFTLRWDLGDLPGRRILFSINDAPSFYIQLSRESRSWVVKRHKLPRYTQRFDHVNDDSSNLVEMFNNCSRLLARGLSKFMRSGSATACMGGFSSRRMTSKS